jgi:Glutamate-cysteine ligase family 2(GCS2)
MMHRTDSNCFRFGLEAEFMLADVETYRPLWHHDLTFAELNETLESIRVDDLPPLDGLDLEPPHRKLMPFAVEGYHVPAPDLSPIDLLPKGIEIRTPVCRSIGECVACFRTLHDRLQAALIEGGYGMVSLSHHPTEYTFDGPQNKRRYDFWQWAMEVMVTYGPDINVSLPGVLNGRLDATDLHAKVNYYGPAMAALTLASPLYRGGLWTIRGRVGKSIRTWRRSVIAPAIELHPHEKGRLEFKLFEATNRLADYHAYFLLWVTVLLDEGLTGRAHNQTRIYDLGAVAQFGLEVESVRERAHELLNRAPAVLERYGFDPSPLEEFRQRVDSGRLPADDIMDDFRKSESLTDVLRQRAGLLDDCHDHDGNGAVRRVQRHEVVENQ